MLKISIETVVQADIENVWSAWNTPDDINQWNAASDDWHNPRSRNDLRVGGTFSYRMEAKDGSFGFDFEGTYTTVVPHKLIEYTMSDNRTVSIAFVPAASGGIRITETFDAEDVNSAELQRQGWQSILNRFNTYVTTRK